MSDLPRLTVIVPCFNEERFVGPLLDNILGQDYPDDRVEVILADGLSTDRTADIIDGYVARFPRIRRIVNHRRHVPFALNQAIRHATGDVIVRMDAHASFPANYLRLLVETLLRSDVDVENVGAMLETQPGAQTAEALAIALTTSHPLGVGNAHFRLSGQEERFVDTVPFGCFRRELFDRIGLFDEQLPRNQDDEFNGRILRSGGRILLIPSVKVRYFARENLTKLGGMFYQYGLFKPLVNAKLGAPATIRQFAPPLLVAAILLGSVLAWVSSLALWGLIALLGLYGVAILAASLQLARRRSLSVFAYCGLSFPVIHGSYGAGYLVGLYRFTLRRQQARGDDRPVASTR